MEDDVSDLDRDTLADLLRRVVDTAIEMKDRAEKAEAERDRLRESLRQIAHEEKVGFIDWLNACQQKQAIARAALASKEGGE